MKFSIIHPTARLTGLFEHTWWKAFDSALTTCDAPESCEYVIIVHHSRIRDFHADSRPFNRKLWGRLVVVTNFGRDCLVDQCNAGTLAAQGEIILGNQDDMRYPEHWDTEVLQLIPDTRELIAVQARTDGGRKDLLTIPSIWTRALSRKLGLIPTEYDGMFSDDETSAKVWRFARVVQSPLYFEHKHFTQKTAEMDAVYESENRKEAYEQGWKVFQERKAEGFPRIPFPDEDPASPEAALVPPAYPILAMCIPGKEFSGPWFDAFMALGAELRDQQYLVKRFRAYHSNVYNTRINLTERVIEDAKISGDSPKYVLWIDSDNVVMPQHLTGLLKFLDHYPQVDAIAGWCWIKKDHGWTTSVGDFWTEDGVHLCAFNGDALFAGETDIQKFAPKKIDHTGFPLLLMRYEALELLGPYAFRPLTKADLPAYFQCSACGGSGFHYADDGKGGHVRTSESCDRCDGSGGFEPKQEVADHWFCGEDTAWCLQAKKAGLTIVVDPGCPVGHVKLQLQAPITEKFTDETPEAEKDRSISINGNPVTGPPELERVMSMI